MIVSRLRCMPAATKSISSERPVMMPGRISGSSTRRRKAEQQRDGHGGGGHHQAVAYRSQQRIVVEQHGIPAQGPAVRRKSADAFAVEGVNTEHRDGEIQEREDQHGVEAEPGGAFHRKLQRFSRRSVVVSSNTTKINMHNEMAAPSGQSYAAPNRLTTTFEIIMPLGPPSSSGARKSPRLSTKAKVAPASTPGNARGRITVRKMRKPDAPRSAEASTRLRGICSSDA